MRNLLLILILANILALAWQYWIEPPPPPVTRGDGLALYAAPGNRAGAGGGDAAGPGPPPGGGCFRLGPLASAAAAQQAGETLMARGIEATPFSRDAPVWLGHWVQAAGFESVAAAETTRARLAAGGLPDALLMQDGPEPLISLGVFRERAGADRVADAARRLGVVVAVRDRYRPGVEHWLRIRPREDQALTPADLALAGDRILRVEPTDCGTPDPAAGAGVEPL